MRLRCIDAVCLQRNLAYGICSEGGPPVGFIKKKKKMCLLVQQSKMSSAIVRSHRSWYLGAPGLI
jgi:hypothetical protein